MGWTHHFNNDDQRNYQQKEEEVKEVIEKSVDTDRKNGRSRICIGGVAIKIGGRTEGMKVEEEEEIL